MGKFHIYNDIKGKTLRHREYQRLCAAMLRSGGLPVSLCHDTGELSP